MTQNEHVCVICCRQEVAGAIISSEHVNTIKGFAVSNFEVASFSTFRNIRKKTFRDGDWGGHWRQQVKTHSRFA